MTTDTNQNSNASEIARQDWLPMLMIGLVAVLACPLTDSLMGEPVASHSVRIAFAGLGALSLAHAAFGVRSSVTRDKLICGAWAAFGALFAVLDVIAAANV